MQNNKLNVNNKKIYIEFLRIMAAFLVIVNHTNSSIFLNTEPSLIWFVSIAYFFISRIAVPIFLMIMGALLLDKQDDTKKYFSRIIRMSAVIAVFSVAIHLFRKGSMSPVSLLAEILNSGHVPYWYLYLYLALLLILPFMQKLAKSLDKKEIMWLIAVTLILGGTEPFFKFAGLGIHTSFFDGLFTCYIGMIFAGYYIEKHMDITKKKAVGAAAGFAAIMFFQVAVSYAAYYIKGGSDYLFLGDIKAFTLSMSAVCIYIAVKYVFSNTHISEKTAKIIKYIGSLTLGIYLVADYFGTLYEPICVNMMQSGNNMAAVIIYEILIFVSAAVLTAVLKCIPIIKKLI